MKSPARENGRKKKAIVAETIGYQGICPTCEHLRLCSFRHRPGTPVTFCEEFANNGAPKMVNAAPEQEVFTDDNALSERYKGLCATCGNVNGCIFPKDEAGIWHCEEYR